MDKNYIQPSVIIKEMGMTHKEFYREFPRLRKNAVYQSLDSSRPKRVDFDENESERARPAVQVCGSKRSADEGSGCKLDNGIQFLWKGKVVEIHLASESERKLGPSLVLPTTIVTLSFYGFTPEEQSDFIDHFNLTYMRGGG